MFHETVYEGAGSAPWVTRNRDLDHVYTHSWRQTSQRLVRGPKVEIMSIPHSGHSFATDLVFAFGVLSTADDDSSAFDLLAFRFEFCRWLRCCLRRASALLVLFWPATKCNNGSLMVSPDFTIGWDRYRNNLMWRSTTRPSGALMQM